MILQGVGKPEGCKLIRFTAEVEDSIIKTIQVRGDFFAIPEESFEELESLLRGTALADLAVRFAELAETLQLELEGISGKGLAELIEAAWKRASIEDQPE